MDPGKALSDDGPAPKVARLQCCMFPARAFTIVFVSNHHPSDAMFLSGNGNKVRLVSQRGGGNSFPVAHEQVNWGREGPKGAGRLCLPVYLQWTRKQLACIEQAEARWVEPWVGETMTTVGARDSLGFLARKAT